METKKILFGFNNDKFEKSIKDLLKQIDWEAEVYARTSKAAVRDMVRKVTDLDAVVLTETIDGGGLQKRQKYVAEEFASLADESNANLIVVISENWRGTDYMRVLLDAGITCAIFVSDKKGVMAKDVATMIARRRTKKEAREYYGIGHEKADLGFLGLDEFSELYERFRTRQGAPLENYLFICRNLGNPKQVADFTKRLPKDDLDYLASFDEFHAVMGALREMGYDLKVKRPKTTSVGLKNTLLIGTDGGTMTFTEEAVREEAGTDGREEAEAEEKPKKKGLFSFGAKKRENDEPQKTEPCEAVKKAQEDSEKVPEKAEENVVETVSDAKNEEKVMNEGESLPETAAAAVSEAGGEPQKTEPAAEENGRGEVFDFADLSMEEMLAMMGGVQSPVSGGTESGTAEERQKPVAEESQGREEPQRDAVKEENKEEEIKAETRRAEPLKEETKTKAAEKPRTEFLKKEKEAQKKEAPKKPEEPGRKGEPGEKDLKAAKKDEASVKKESAEAVIRKMRDESEDRISEEFPLFGDEFDDVELETTRGGKSGLYVLAVVILLIMLAVMWYLGKGASMDDLLDATRYFGGPF